MVRVSAASFASVDGGSFREENNGAVRLERSVFLDVGVCVGVKRLERVRA
jgi:hypothetical protein